MNFSPCDKKSTAMLEDGRYPFASKAVDYASREASICPNARLLDEAQKDMNVYDKLQIQPVRPQNRLIFV